jgi:sugar O-acyltransferase (sialic acid O-acetyltransferase NeuD family)
MKDLVIVGAGALGQEVAWLVEEINDREREWNILGYLDDFTDLLGTQKIGYPVLGPYSMAKEFRKAYFVIAFGDARLREKMAIELTGIGLKWANLYSPTVRIHPSNKIGKGVVIGRYTDLTVNCDIGDFVYLNIHCVLGHEVRIGKYSIVSPNVTINGGATIGSGCQIGANAFIREVIVGDHVIVGASSCVVKNVESDCVVAGVPAKMIHQGPANTSISRSEREPR